MAVSAARNAQLPRYVENRHIDHIPAGARHGKPWHQFAFWFGSNVNVFNVVVGAVIVSIGLTFWQALIAIAVGTLIGAVLIALHATQGPRLGVPQTIQSRGQFGFYGAAFMFPAVLLINLADYFLVRRGRYDVASFFTADGAYGRFAWHGLLAYTAGLAAEWPFVSQPYYTGPLVRNLGGADVSWLVGWFAAAVAYLLLIAFTPGTARRDPADRRDRLIARHYRPDQGATVPSAASSMPGQETAPPAAAYT
jgi:purine-cytosine permease-like protein